MVSGHYKVFSVFSEKNEQKKQVVLDSYLLGSCSEKILVEKHLYKENGQGAFQ